MIKNVSDPSIASILSTDALKVYTISRYQREYTWSQRDWANLNDDLVSVDSWTKEQIEARTEKLVELALQAFAFTGIEI